MRIPVTFSQIDYIYTSADLPNGSMVSWGVRNNASMSPGEIAEGAVGVWNANLKGICPGRVGLNAVRVKNGPNLTGPDTVLSVGSLGAGGSGTVIANCALLVRKHTNIGGRRGRGRAFMPFISETELDQGMNVTSAYLTTATSAFAEWLSDMTSIELQPVLLHTHPDDAPNTITNLSIDTLVATQRRRLRG